MLERPITDFEVRLSSLDLLPLFPSRHQNKYLKYIPKLQWASLEGHDYYADKELQIFIFAHNIARLTSYIATYVKLK